MHEGNADIAGHGCCDSSHDPCAPLEQIEATKPTGDVRDEIVRGLLYIHSRHNANTGEALEALSFVGALVDLLSKKGLISAEELEASRREVGQKLAEQFNEKGL